uniref:GH16 domain-containing protein n=1 Tax=Aegilops tauschii subsp. strangulata TaxID=200361 RepID=A0A453D5M7_AEGTS
GELKEGAPPGGGGGAMAIGLASASFRDNCDIKWNPENAAFSDDGHGLTMSLKSNSSGCLLQTKKQFIYGSVSTLIKLVPGNSAGTVTTYYTSSVGDDHDEIDFEFLGNETGQPYTLHTNVFADGVGKKEMQFVPWFDPTADFHAYTISWTPCMIVWYVDDVPIRVFRNYRDKGIAYPIKRPMFGYSSIWSAEDWATQGGRVKADWSKAPFVAGYRDMVLDVCPCDGADSCVRLTGSTTTASTTGTTRSPAPSAACRSTDRPMHIQLQSDRGRGTHQAAMVGRPIYYHGHDWLHA